MADKVAVKPSLTIKRRFNAPPEKVYAAWTRPEQIAKWLGGHQIVSATAETDVRAGGRYRVSMKSATDEHNVSGVYREVVPNEKLVFTWAWRSTPERESLVTVALKRDGDGTLMTFTHEQFFDEAARDHHEQGWNGSFEKLEKHLS